MFPFCVLNASINCQKWKEKQDKNICLDNLRCYFSPFQLGFEATWKACHFLLPIHSRIIWKQKPSSLSLSVLGYSKMALYFKSTGVRRSVVKKKNNCFTEVQRIEKQVEERQSAITVLQRGKKSKKKRGILAWKVFVQFQHPSFRLLSFSLLAQKVHQVHFLVGEVTYCRYHPLILPHNRSLFQTHTNTHTHAYTHFSLLILFPFPKIPLKPISGINFTYSKLIILWWIVRGRRQEEREERRTLKRAEKPERSPEGES